MEVADDVSDSNDTCDETNDDKPQPDFGHLDLRVVMVNSLGMHPNPDHQVRYVEKIAILTPKELEEEEDDDSEKKIFEEIVESGVPHVYELESLVGLKTIALCNMNPVTTERGFETKIAVLCARQGDQVDFLHAPPDANIGDPVLVDGYKHNPKKPYVDHFIRTFGEDLKVNDKHEVVYKGIPLKAGPTEGIITTITLKDCAVGNIMNLENI